MEIMQRYSWPGNVRELENCVERAVVLSRQTFVTPDDLPPAVLQGALPPNGAGVIVPNASSLQEALSGPEKQIIQIALRANGGNRQGTADQLGINRTTLYKKMKKYGLLE